MVTTNVKIFMLPKIEALFLSLSCFLVSSIVTQAGTSLHSHHDPQDPNLALPPSFYAVPSLGHSVVQVTTPPPSLCRGSCYHLNKTLAHFNADMTPLQSTLGSPAWTGL